MLRDYKCIGLIFKGKKSTEKILLLTKLKRRDSLKKIFIFLKRILVVSFLVLLVLTTAVVFFQKKIKENAIENLSSVANTDIKLHDINISFWQRFPKVSIHLEQIRIKDAIEGSQDSLLSLNDVYLGLDVLSLLKGEYVINHCELSKGFVHVKIDQQGRTNYMLFKSDSTTSTDTSSFYLDIKELILDSVEIVYLDERINNHHQVFGSDVTCSFSQLKDTTKVSINGQFMCNHIGLNNSTYLNNKPFSINTSIQYNSKTHTTSFDQSQLKIDKAYFEVVGSIRSDEFLDWDLSISSPGSDVQTLISLMPSSINQPLLEHKSEGDIYFNSSIIGKQTKTESPSITVDFGFKNASFYHPKINKKITNCNLSGSYTNGSKNNLSTSVLKLEKINGKLDNDLIKGNVVLSDFNNLYIDASLNGNFNLNSALELFPLEEITSAEGRFEINLNFKGLVSDLTNEANTKSIKTSGHLELINANLDITSTSLPLRNFNGLFHFDNHNLGITKFSGKIGQSDFLLDGYLKNFISYVLIKDQVLKIDAKFKSNFIDLDEILSYGMPDNAETGLDTEESNYSFSLAPNLAYDLDCTIDSLKIRRLSSNNIGKNLTGRLNLANQLLNFQNVSMNIADGNVAFNGIINAKDTSKILVRNEATIKNVDVQKAFYILENFEQDFITDQHLRGRLTAYTETILIFDHHLSLDLSSIRSMAEVNISNGKLINFEPMVELGSFLKEKKFGRYLKSTNFDDVSFSELTNTFFIYDQKITIPQMVIVTDIASDMTIEGTHTFNNDMNYQVHFPIINYQKEETRIENGLLLDDNKRWIVYLNLIGNVDNYKVDFDESKSLNSALKAGSERIQTTLEEDVETIELDTTEVIYMK